MKRFAVAGCMCLGLIGFAGALHAADNKGKPEWWTKDPLFIEATKHQETVNMVNEAFKAHGNVGSAVIADKAFKDKLSKRLDQINAEKTTATTGGGPAKAKPASGTTVVAEPPVEATPDPVAPAAVTPAVKGVIRVKESDTEAVYCESCHNGPAPVIPGRQRDDYQDVVDNIPAPQVVYRPNSLGDDGGGCGFLGCISSSNLMWGLGGALVGGVLGYVIGNKHGQNSQNDYYNGYNPYYGGWQGSLYNSGPMLPGAYRLPGSYTYGAPPILPFPGPGIGAGGVGAGGYPPYYGGGMGVGGYGGYGGGVGGAGGYYGGGGIPINVPAYSGVGGVSVNGNVLCPNCTLPTTYPLYISPGASPMYPTR